MSVMILDAGNCIIKAKIARPEFGELAFPHALQPLTENEYKTILSRAVKNTPLLDYIRVIGQPYVIGESVERHGLVKQRSGVSRYTRDYYGVLAAVALGRLYERDGEIKMFGSHPPGDVKFRQDLMETVVGD
jgi:hypothetical protein